MTQEQAEVEILRTTPEYKAWLREYIARLASYERIRKEYINA